MRHGLPALLLGVSLLVLSAPANAQPPASVAGYSPVGRWTANGKLLVAAAGDRLDLRAVRDGFGGAYLMWRDTRDRPEGDIYLKRVGANGATVAPWPESGLLVRAGTTGTPAASLVRGNVGGAYVVVRDDATSSELVAYHFAPDAAAAPGWPSNGLSIPIGGTIQKFVALQEGFGGLTIDYLRVTPAAGEELWQRRWSFTGYPFGSGVLLSSGDPLHNPIDIDFVGAVGDGAGRSHLAVRVNAPDPAYSSSHTLGHRGSAEDYTLNSYLAPPPPRLFGDDLQGAWVFQRGPEANSGAKGYRLGDDAIVAGVSAYPSDSVTGAAADGQGGVIYVVQGIARAMRMIGTPPQWWTLGTFVFDWTSTAQAFVQPDLRGGAFIGSVRTEAGQSSLTGHRMLADGTLDPAWAMLGPGSIRTGPGAVGDVQAMLDGAGGYLVFWLDEREGSSDIFGQSYGPANIVGVEPSPAPGRLVLAPARQPARAGDRIRCTLPDVGAARLEVFDARGRSLWSEDIPAGTGPFVDRALPDGLARGVVWMRLTQGGNAATAKLVVLP